MTVPGIDTTSIPTRFRPVITALARASVTVSELLRRPPGADFAASIGDILETGLPGTGLRWLLGPRLSPPVQIDEAGTLALALIPLDNPANLDANAPVGTLFALHAARPDGPSSFLRPTRAILAAGYVVHGPRCCLVASFGKSVQLYTLDAISRQFRVTQAQVSIPTGAGRIAANAAQYRHWPSPVRRYFDESIAASHSSGAVAGWSGSLVAEAHRVLMRGGICLCPGGGSSDRPRLVTECAPLAFLIEQAGGRATDGVVPILDSPTDDLNGRRPLAFGSAWAVDRLRGFHDQPEAEIPALFAHRGLFRAQGPA